MCTSTIIISWLQHNSYNLVFTLYSCQLAFNLILTKTLSAQKPTDTVLLFWLTGLPVPAVPAGLPTRTRKTPAKKRKAKSSGHERESSSESSDDSDEDWVPGSEEVRKRNKTIKRFIPGSSITVIS